MDESLMNDDSQEQGRGLEFPRSDSPVRILIIAIRAIGDIVLTTPLISLLKKAYPSGYLAVLVDGPSAEVLSNNPSIDRRIRIDRERSQKQPYWIRGKKWVHLVRDLRRERFHIVLDVFSGARSAMLTFLSGAPNRYGEDFRQHGRGFLYNHPIKIQRDGRHLVEQKLDLVQALLRQKNIVAGDCELFLTEQERQAGKTILSLAKIISSRRIGLVPCAGSIWRMWPAERFVKLGNALNKIYQAEIVLLGGKADRSVCQAIEEKMEGNVLNLSGKTSLRESMAVIAELDLVISNVTGPMHLASALPKPTVLGIYGAADTVQYAPWGKYAMMVSKGSKEDAYWDKVDYQKDYEYLCQITVEDVLETVATAMPDWSPVT